ncbi:hypothetical protein FXV77_18665 [Sphingobacterium phlebotomi]|uniref:Neutral/alkaline non-lysosomal ceramidase N-terminal domain-containing protein n=1 Tax=Sphingobacterium phlebotomi TaxID=2605433 RepID=A0A5D4GUS6_9SPHI|nr:neutral/alkaline non-lysosomal ceramidase N-terminal domain-containing protein [Sphingobacterium phlebotomi]TYR32631.1 hypothetical protein FXV77_18665 [Sphingobacterium phlebotomi]
MNNIKNITWLAIMMTVLMTISCKPEKKNKELLYNNSTVDITPDSRVLLAGFANRQGPSDTVHHALLSQCVVLQHDTTKICIITNDLMEIAPEYIAEIRKQIHQATGIPASNIILTVSHTHSAPIMDAMGLGWSEANDRYRQQVIDQIAQNAIRALKDSSSFVKSGIATGIGTSGISISRRSIDPKTGESVIGESNISVDQEISILQLQDNAGKALSTWFNYACHPVVLGFPSRAVSPDFVGQARNVVTGKWGGNALFFNAAAGDINPKKGLTASVQTADDVGAELGEAIIQTALKKDETAPVLKHVCASLQLPYRDQHITPAFVDEQVALKSAQQTEFIDWKNDVKKWGERMKAEIKEKGELPDYRTSQMSALRIGSSVILFVQGEYFNSYQVRLKNKFSDVNLLFAGYSNGESGYIPDGKSFAAKGYEVDQAYIYIHEPSPLSSEAEQVALDAMENLIKQVL